MNVQNSMLDFTVLKDHQKAAWASGDYSAIGVTMQIVGELLAETLNLPAGSKVLDVAAGNGSTSLAFARQFQHVTSTDFVGELLAKGAARAAAEGFEIDFRVADVEALPFTDNEFDAVTSTFGVMFAPDQKQAAAEMLRVVRPGGRIGLASWTPSGFIGQFGKIVGAHKAPPSGVMPPVRWGDENWIRETFDDAREISVQRRTFILRFRNAQHMLNVFKHWYGPVHKIYTILSDDAAQSLDADILTLVEAANTAKGASIRIPAEYLEVTIVK